MLGEVFSQCRAGSSQVTEGVATHRAEGMPQVINIININNTGPREGEPQGRLLEEQYSTYLIE